MSITDAIKQPCADCIIDAESGVTTPDADHKGPHLFNAPSEATIRERITKVRERDPFALVGPYRTKGAANRDILRDLARDLYELHLRTSISLDEWKSARAFVERYYGRIPENGA